MDKKSRVRAREKLCRDCEACIMGCSVYHENECNAELSRVTVEKDMERFEFHIRICRQCKNPKCIAACPEEAMYMDENSIVHIIDDKCTRCGQCNEACPFEAIFYNKEKDRYIKCDMCTGRSEGPLCVELCPVGALTIITIKSSGE